MSKGREKKDMAIIRIDLHSMAIAPAHHNLILKSWKNRRKVVGRLAFEADFKQSPVVELGIREIFVELEKSHDMQKQFESGTFDTISKRLIKLITDPSSHRFGVDHNSLKSAQLIFSLEGGPTKPRGEIPSCTPSKAKAIVSLHDHGAGNESETHARQERAFSEPLREGAGKLRGNINGYVSIKRVRCKMPEQMQYGVHSENGIGLSYSSVLVHDFVSAELPKEVDFFAAHSGKTGNR